MKGSRAVLVAAAVAVVVLAAPAAGQGKVAPPELYWTQVLGGGPAITSYDFGAVQQYSATWFRLGNVTAKRSGKLKIKLTGSPAFVITENRCVKKFIGIGKLLSCWVGVAYTPFRSDAFDNAVLTAKGTRGKAVSLSLSGHGAGAPPPA